VKPLSNSTNHRRASANPRQTLGSTDMLSQEAFRKIIALERKRSERSSKPFLLLLAGISRPLQNGHNERLLLDVLMVLARSIRETDAIGWYADGTMAGVMFTEIGCDRDAIIPGMKKRVGESLDHLGSERASRVDLSFHLFPDSWDHDAPGSRSNLALYPDLATPDESRKAQHGIKRVMDIAGSACALVVLAPVLALIAVAIKLTSKGPVFFRQRRVGQFGECFTFLKFRSMYCGNDDSEHKEFVRNLIQGKKTSRRSADQDGPGVFKLTNDRRITTVGRFLRRTGLDELPQLFNVLMGEMSLVGPRPAIPYEVEAYDIWYRRRLLEAKPGITGLWQVEGRSRVKFDDMVRLDLHYVCHWTPWMDIRILLRTPAAIVSGEWQTRGEWQTN
jgi:lipopolysaccharide/colanic/teichoic acid biosynthesis glycosyltransferase